MKKSFNHYFFWFVNYYLLPHPREAFKKIDSVISLLPNIKKGQHLYGSIEWRYKNKPIGHIHGNRIVDILFPKEIQANLLLDNRVTQNKYVKYGVSLYLKTNEDIDFAIELLTQSYYLISSKTDKNESV